MIQSLFFGIFRRFSENTNGKKILYLGAGGLLPTIGGTIAHIYKKIKHNLTIVT